MISQNQPTTLERLEKFDLFEMPGLQLHNLVLDISENKFPASTTTYGAHRVPSHVWLPLYGSTE